jgi:hypothetical protein
LPTNLLLNATEAAARVKMPTLRFLALARRGRLRIIGQTPDGHLLFREKEVDRVAREAPARDLYEPDNRGLPPGLLPCGCMFAPPVRAGDNEPAGDEPEFLCREAQGLDLARRLTAALAAAASNDPFFARLASIAAAALDQHLGRVAAESQR